MNSGDANIDISIILCTYNRCRILEKALQSIAASVMPESRTWEVLVVDNNSNDGTRETSEAFCRRYPGRFRYYFESRQGKSFALNSGISEARGEILVFTDDDVTMEPTWLDHLTTNLFTGEYAGAGGRTLPNWGCPVPKWLFLEARYALAPFAVFDLGPGDAPLTEPPYGANMAFHKSMFEKYGGFRIDLAGPEGFLRNDDTEFGSRLLAGGERLLYQGSAVVYHPVSADRMCKPYLLNWSFTKGRADIRAFGLPADTKYFWQGIPLRFVRNLAMGTIRWMISLKPPLRFQNKLRVWGKAGAIRECYYQSRKAMQLR